MAPLESTTLSVEDAVACMEALLLAACSTGLDARVAAAMPSMWRHGTEYLHSADAGRQVLGYSLLLSAIRSTPGGAQSLLQALQDALQGQGPCGPR